MDSEPDITAGDIVTIREYCRDYVKPPKDGSDRNVRERVIRDIRDVQETIGMPLLIELGRGKPVKVSIEMLRNHAPGLLDSSKRQRRLADAAISDFKERHIEHNKKLNALRKRNSDLRETVVGLQIELDELKADIIALRKSLDERR